jgi:hypothetical protein
MNIRPALAVLALVAAAAPVAVAGTATAGDGDVVRRGSCSGSTDWKLKAKHDDGRIELEYEVDSNQSGQTWRVRVRDNGVRVIATRATTGGRSGSFDIERKVANRAGSDSFVARARDLSSGQLCVARLTF